MSAFKLIVFDYDGTLFDTRPAIVQSLRRAFADCGRTIPAAATLDGVVGAGLPLRDSLLLLEPRLRNDRVALDEMVVTYRRFHRDEAASLQRPWPGTLEALCHLDRAGIICVVVSNKGVDAINHSLLASGISAIDLVLGDQPGVPRKPDPALVADFVLPRFPGIARQQMLMVGDTEVDILFARRARLQCCWSAYGYGNAQRCRALRPDYEISTISSLPGLVLGSELCSKCG